MIEVKKKNYLFFIFKILIFIISCYLIYSNISNEKKFFYVFNQIDITSFLVVLLITIILNHIQIFVQIKAFLRKKMNDISFIKYSKIFFNSQMISFILPHSGIIYKTYELKKFNLSYKDFIAVNLFLTWFYLFFFIAFYSFEILIFGNNILGSYSLFIFAIGILASLTLFILPFLYNKFIKIDFKNKIFSKVYDTLNYILLLPVTFMNKKFFKFLAIYGVLGHILSFLLIYLLFNSIDQNIKFSFIILFFVTNSFLDQVPITPKNLAISELVFGMVSSNIGLGFEFGVAIKLLIRLFFFINLISLTILYNTLDQINRNEKRDYRN